VTAAVGAVLEALGVSYLQGTQVSGRLEKRPTSLVIVIPALLLFSPMFLGAVLLFRKNFEGPTPAGLWIGSTVFLLLSAGIVWALLRDIARRFDRNAPEEVRARDS
jgi:hypothetical protein